MQNTNIFTFFLYSNSLATFLNLVHFIIEACMKLNRTKISEDVAH